MIKHFRPEFEAHIEAARERAEHDLLAAPVGADLLAASPHSGPGVG